MSRLYLLRHARAAWPSPGQNDFNRPLEQEGFRDARRVGDCMASRHFSPDRVICSTALRARQTWKTLCARIDYREDRATFTDNLYHSDVGTYSEVITESAGDGSLLLIGHNPMLEDVARALAAHGEGTARRALRSGFSACGLAIIDFEGPIHDARPDAGYLRMFLQPHDLQTEDQF